MTPERLDYLNKENILRGECSITRDELHWLFTRLREMTARKEALQKRLQEVNPDQPLAGWKAGDGPGLSEPVWGESKASEQDQVSALSTAGTATGHSRQTEAPSESGTLRGDYERMVQRWQRHPNPWPHMLDDIAALLARVADED